MSKSLERKICDVIEGKGPSGVFSCVAKSVLFIISVFFRFASRMRRELYHRGVFRTLKASLPVISVGNIVAGGTGKTPCTLMLGKELLKHKRVAILSRGYRSEAEKMKEPLTLSLGSGVLHSAAVGGDEAWLLSKNLPSALVYSGRSRIKAAEMAYDAGAEVGILDDGFQHWPLERDIDIVTVDAGNPCGFGYFLPRGYLREPLSALKRADCVVINNSVDEEHFLSVKEKLSRYTSAAIVGTAISEVTVMDLFSPEQRELKGVKVGVFSGIAKPENFLATVKACEAEVVETFFCEDHVVPTYDELVSFASSCKKKGGQILLCTEKDAVKLLEEREYPLPLAYVGIKLSVRYESELWSSFLSRKLYPSIDS
jgi:tetraacyldisaccharide 4'-kinase